MKKFFSTVIVVVTVFVFTAFAGDPQQPTCADGHMHLPGYSCVPRDGELNHGNRGAADDSTLTYLQTLIAEYNPFIFFLK